MSAVAPIITDEKGQPALLKDLAEAVSTQAQVANRFWLALITVSLFALIPHTLTAKGNISLPFNLGDVPPFWFYGLIFSFLAVLSIAFASAHAQQIRAQKLAHSVIDSLGFIVSQNCPIHPREYFDMLCKPSLNRVASLAQSLRGRHQFFSTKHELSKRRRIVTVIYYGLLKVLSFIIYFLLPIVALWHAHRDFSASGILHAYNIVGTVVSGFALLQVFWLDLICAVGIIRHLWASNN